jgi:hypothetical protein
MPKEYLVTMEKERENASKGKLESDDEEEEEDAGATAAADKPDDSSAEEFKDKDFKLI